MSDCELPEFYTWRTPVARKAHKCCECHAPIAVGEKYFHLSAKWEGTICRERQHLLCMEACMYVRDHIAEECLYYGELMEWFHNYWDDKALKSDPETKHMRKLMARIIKRRRLAGVA